MTSTQLDNTANAGETTAKPSASSNTVAPLPGALQTGEIPSEIVDTPTSDFDAPSAGHNPDPPSFPRHISPSKPSPVYDFSAVEDASERDWWAKGFKYLKDAGLGDLWNGTVDAFYEHEELMEFGVRPFLFHHGLFLPVLSLINHLCSTFASSTCLRRLGPRKSRIGFNRPAPSATNRSKTSSTSRPVCATGGGKSSLRAEPGARTDGLSNKMLSWSTGRKPGSRG